MTPTLIEGVGSRYQARVGQHKRRALGQERLSHHEARARLEYRLQDARVAVIAVIQRRGRLVRSDVDIVPMDHGPAEQRRVQVLGRQQRDRHHSRKRVQYDPESERPVLEQDP